jgi:2-keto-4-pentenoate hydratase/2-oxohepta-3-ene-1,7-dioic acid hydratase in catechol pathway
MKLVTFNRHGERGYGMYRDGFVDLPSRDFLTRYPTLRAVLDDSAAGRELRTGSALSGISVARNELTLLPPIVDPRKILCVGLNYETHRKETGRAASPYPAIFVRFADTQVGDGSPIVRPAISTSLDFEGELAVVIGRPGKSIAREDALAHVAGYACYNDATIRDWQHHTHQFTPGKNFPNTAAFGPWLVTADEIPDPSQLQLTTRLNGRTVQSASPADMIFSVAEIIAYVSAFTPLSVGDVIATGTPGGVGVKRTPPLFMQPGDTVEVEISHLGTLRNPIIAELLPFARPRASDEVASHVSIH